MTISMKRATQAGVLVLLGLGLCRSATFRFQEKEQAFRKANQEQLQKLGMTRGAAKANYPTPEIHMVTSGCLAPGGTGDVVVKGKFAPGTKFIFQNDNLEVVKESLTGGEYRATLKVAPGIGPQTATLVAITPVTGITVRADRAAVVGGNYEWNLDAANGWKIVARSLAAKVCGDSSASGDPYELLFYRKGEAKPFEKRSATLFFSLWERTNYRFSISQQDSQTQAGAEDIQALAKKMLDPNTPEAQRDQLMKRMEKMQEEMMANMSKMANPAYIKEMEAKRLEFGCERIELEVPGSNVTGTMGCSQKVGNRIALTGTMKPVAR